MSDSKLPLRILAQDGPFSGTIDDLFPAIQSSYIDKRHEMPCPIQKTEDIADDHEVNEWVLNHLPFGSNEQRLAFMASLVSDQQKKKSHEGRVKWRLVHKKIKEQKAQTSLKSVKEITKS